MTTWNLRLLAAAFKNSVTVIGVDMLDGLLGDVEIAVGNLVLELFDCGDDVRLEILRIGQIRVIVVTVEEGAERGGRAPERRLLLRHLLLHELDVFLADDDAQDPLHDGFVNGASSCRVSYTFR